MNRVHRLPIVAMVLIGFLLAGCAEGPTGPGVFRWFSSLSTQSLDGYDLGFTYQDCISDLSLDADLDNFNDNCEAALAKAFNPMLVIYDTPVSRALRDPRYAVVKKPNVAPKTVEIIYLLGYARDYGSFGGLSAHNGDSEFIVIRIVEEGGRWKTVRMFLSAHYKVKVWPFGSFDTSEIVNHTNIEYVDAPRGRSFVHVSQDKHANYRSKARCNQITYDTCGTVIANQQALPQIWPISEYLARNVGSKLGSLVDCVTSPQLGPGTECYWTHTSGFYGWRGKDGARPMPYSTILRHQHFGGPPIPSIPTVVIDGPAVVAPNSGCGAWSARLIGDNTAPPYQFEWYLNGTQLVSQTATYSTWIGTQDLVITVVAYDAFSQSTFGVMTVSVVPGTICPE